MAAPEPVPAALQAMLPYVLPAPASIARASLPRRDLTLPRDALEFLERVAQHLAGRPGTSSSPC